ncbi:hypothetical protein HAX54_052926 [Datura stramonium]|uniref:Uncharacterized protein n=1 Tax=Datura stramonium TaxID=4076 RepID=A0ABS8SZK6_DATST|nr:hypothetical protein [Datura stramonium]
MRPVTRVRRGRDMGSLSLGTRATWCRGAGGSDDPLYHDGRSDGRQPGDGPSLASSRSGPYNSWATEVLMDRQLSDGPSPKPRFSDLLFKSDGGDDGPSGLPGAEVMGEVTARHTSDGGSDGRQPATDRHWVHRVLVPTVLGRRRFRWAVN